jgi:hypothetical protein
MTAQLPWLDVPLLLFSRHILPLYSVLKYRLRKNPTEVKHCAGPDFFAPIGFVQQPIDRRNACGILAS